MMEVKGRFILVCVVVTIIFVTYGFSDDIHKAVEAGDLKTVQKLLKKNPDLAVSSDDNGNILIRRAIFSENDEITKLIVSYLTDIDISNERGQTALIYASYVGRLEIAKLLINRGANVNHQNRAGMTAAHYAIQRENKEILRLLIQSKANLNLKNDDGDTPVILAFKRENGDIIDVIVEAIVIKPKNLSERAFYLHRAARMGKSKLVAELLTNDVINLQDEMKRTVLHNASAGGLIDIVKKLHSKGMKINANDIYGSTPLHEAVLNDQMEMVELLIAGGADINSKQPDGATALNIAKEKKNNAMVKLLLSKGASQINSKKDFPVLTGSYLGQKPPGEKAELFAPGIISKSDSYDHLYGFFNNNTLFLYGSFKKGFSGNWTQVPIPIMEYKNDKWSEPYDSKLTGKPWFYNVPNIPVGKQYFFAWRKNIDGSGPSSELYLWSSTKTAEGWSKPKRLPPPINTGFDTWPRWSDSGTLYFHSGRGGGYGGADIWESKPVNGNYTEVNNAGPQINSKHNEHDAFISKDGSYILWSSFKPGGFGEDDIYVAYKKSDGTWTEAINLGEGINSSLSENRVYVTPDEKYIFFASPRYGLLDIFWVDASIIEKLKPNNLK